MCVQVRLRDKSVGMGMCVYNCFPQSTQAYLLNTPQYRLLSFYFWWSGRSKWYHNVSFHFPYCEFEYLFMYFIATNASFSGPMSSAFFQLYCRSFPGWLWKVPVFWGSWACVSRLLTVVFQFAIGPLALPWQLCREDFVMSLSSYISTEGPPDFCVIEPPSPPSHYKKNSPKDPIVSASTIMISFSI